MIMKHLLWKDAVAIRPLFMMILFGIAASFTLCLFASAWASESSVTAAYASFWILMPNLVALGAPAILVGTEEESGTLGWLRTLPVPWIRVAHSKFLIGLGAVLLTWALSSITLVAARMTFAVANTPIYRDWTSLAGVNYLLTFSLLLLVCGFITAYLFRSPVTGLVVVVPLILLVNALTMGGYRAILDQRTYQPNMEAIPTLKLLILVLGGMALVLVGWGAHLLLARRRLTSPASSPRHRLASDHASPSAYSPPRFLTMVQPSKRRALLWQQYRQMGWFSIALAVLVAVVLVICDNPSRNFRFIAEIAPLIVWVSVAWIGGLTFYGDNVRRRVDFFADRGVSATQIWLSRLLLPTMLSVVLLIVASRGRPVILDVATWMSLIWIAFGFGQLVGQWVRRPVLTFFAAPTFAAVVAFFHALIFSLYYPYLWLTFFVTPVLLFASWRLTSRWIANRIDFGYHWRVVAYSALAIALPIACLFAIRIATTPELDVAWRSKMLQSNPLDESSSDATWISPIAFGHVGVSGEFEELDEEGVLLQLQKELDSDTVGEHIVFDEAITLLDQDSAVTRKTIEVLLKWSRVVREQTLNGNAGFALLESAAERSESRAVSHLQAISGMNPSTEIAELIEQIPDAELRKKSRRMAIIQEWNRYRSVSWKGATGIVEPKTFMNALVAYSVKQIPFERKRADRYVDEMTKLMIGQLDKGLPRQGSIQFFQRSGMFYEFMGPEATRYRQYWPPACTNWTQDYEESIQALRSKSATSQ